MSVESVFDMTLAELQQSHLDRYNEIEWLHCCIDQSLEKFRQPKFVPARIRLERPINGVPPGEYDVTSNRWGAIRIPLDGDKFQGVRPTECVVLRMTKNEKRDADQP